MPQPRPDDRVETVQCPICKRGHTTRFTANEQVHDVTCQDCLRERIQQEMERERRPQG